MHTPEQAQGLWCPHVRVPHDVGSIPGYPGGVASVNSGVGQGLQSCFCIANQCAMWRWHPTTLLHPTTGEITSAGPGGLTDRVPAKGFCGLAGVPVTI